MPFDPDFIDMLCKKYNLDSIKIYKKFESSEVTGKRDYQLLKTRMVIIAYREVLSRPKFRFPIDLVDDLIDGICRRAISVTADTLDIDLPDSKDKVFYEVTMEGRKNSE